MAKQNNNISGYFSGEKTPGPELIVREAFLRTAKEALDGCGIEDWSLEQIRGATMMMEKAKQVMDENGI